MPGLQVHPLFKHLQFDDIVDKKSIRIFLSWLLPVAHKRCLGPFVLIFFLLSVGTSTDGEFEQLRRRGETRPLHIWQVAHDACDSVSKMSETTLLQMLELQGGINK